MELICKKCNSELLMVEYSDHNYYFFCGQCGDKKSELEIYFSVKKTQWEDVDYEEPQREW